MIAGGLLIICAFRISSAAKGVVDEPVDYEPFDVPLPELEKESKKMTTLTHQCAAFKQHYRYYCKTSNIARYNEEVRIICERYDLLCKDRVPATVDHIRRQKLYWKQSGMPKATEKTLVDCFTSCRETDPLCVHACECINMQWIMDIECGPGANANALSNCQRWYQKCKEFWKPLPDLTPYPKGEFAPPPLARGVYFAYDPLGNYKTFNIPRDHGVSFWRGTQSTVVNWPEGKISGATTWDVPFMGIEGIFNAYEVGFPNYAAAAKDFQRKFPDPGTGSLNPGTGRA
ncbi:hypothetical protein QR680_000043 [Steinernema hermaphroditum]|uniref:Folate receptor-like domain-containing protein n=1 Tax=Steinernema hermaphroditum TaxID=289476 RepID=A0AA39LCU7_9BILA|nr:hypothetical protein QR680_000043 [Steinernema hermaphroditum]